MKAATISIALALALSLSACGGLVDFGIRPINRLETIWNPETNQVERRPVQLVPAFYQRLPLICRQCGHTKPDHFPWCDPTHRRDTTDH